MFVHAQACLYMRDRVYLHMSVFMHVQAWLCVLEHVFARMKVSLHAHLHMCAYLCIEKLHLTHILSQSFYQFAGLVHGQLTEEMTKTMQPLQWKTRQNLKEKVIKI